MPESTDHHATLEATFTSVSRLWMLSAIVSAIGLAITAVLTVTDPADVTWVVWLRGAVVTVASVVFVWVTALAARGNRRAYSRMRLISVLAPIGIVLILIAPDAGYPLWMKVEQGIVGAIIVAIAALLNRRSVRSSFGSSPAVSAADPR